MYYYIIMVVYPTRSIYHQRGGRPGRSSTTWRSTYAPRRKRIRPRGAKTPYNTGSDQFSECVAFFQFYTRLAAVSSRPVRRAL